MGHSSASDGERTSLSPASSVPLLVFAAGGLILLFGAVQILLAFLGDESIVVALFDLLFVVIPGGILLYAGYWMPHSEISPRYYPRLIVWLVGGVAVMFGFILLRDLHPGVTAEWSVGTQAIALMIGSLGGLLIGIQETKATIRAAQLEEHTHELEAQERRLTRQNERLEEFASVVSHDLRNPLNVAEGRLELARGDYDSEHLAAVSQAHDRMEALIEDLLALAREGDAVTDYDRVPLGAVLEDCWTNVETSGATLLVDVDRDVRADESRIKQLFENLFRNAVEHSSTGSLSHAQGDAVEHGSTSPPSHAQGDAVDHGGADVTVSVGELDGGFYVEDDGPGIPPDERDDVFETGYSTSREGTGFGLSIVGQVVDAHGWEVRVTEGTDGGARFEITGVEWAE